MGASPPHYWLLASDSTWGPSHPTGPLLGHESQHPALSSPTRVPEVPLMGGGPDLSPMESRPLVQSHLQSQGHEFSGSGYQHNPNRQVEKGRPGKALEVITAATTRQLIVRSDGPDVSLAAQWSRYHPQGREGGGSQSSSTPSPGCPPSRNLRDMLPPVT